MVDFISGRTIQNTLIAAAALFGLCVSQASAAQLLLDPSFEGSTDNLNNPNWTLDFTAGDGSLEPIYFQNSSFAAHTGEWGVWFRSFLGEAAEPVDALVEQQVAASAGVQYDLSAFFKIEENFTAADLLLSLIFLDAADNPLDELFISVLAADPKDGVWRMYSVSGIAPVGTVAAVARIAMTGGTNPGMNPQSALLDDISLTDMSPIPLPASLPLFAFGLAALLAARRSKTAASSSCRRGNPGS